MKHPIEKMRKCLALLPPPGGEVVAECLDEIELLRHQVTVLRDVMQEVLDDVWLKTSHELARKFSEALAATKEN